MFRTSTEPALTVHARRLPPEDADSGADWDAGWDETEFRGHEAELVLELYLQGRAYHEVADLTGYPVGVVRELARLVGMMRDPEEDERLELWRTRARTALATMTREQLVFPWIDGAEPEELARQYRFPPDLVWEAIARQMASIGSRSVLNNHRPPPSCVLTCDFACTRRCAYTVPTSGNGRPIDDIEPRPGNEPPSRGALPQGRLRPEITIDPDGHATWRDPTEEFHVDGGYADRSNPGVLRELWTIFDD